jgi:S1 RNA binding domain protein
MVGETVRENSTPQIGEIADCKVEQVMPYGAFVRLSNGKRGMIHISELSHKFVKQVTDVLQVDQEIKAKVIKIDEKGRIDLSLKQLQSKSARDRDNRGSSQPVNKEENFEKKLSDFLKQSETKITDLNNRTNSSRSGHKKGKKPQ